MADELTRQAREYGFAPFPSFGDDRTSRTGTPTTPALTPFAPGDMTRVPTPESFGAVPAAGSTYPIYPWSAAPLPAVEAPPAAFTGSPLNTLYGIDSESYLTEDQRKLARQIQGKFDASMNRRDRALAQYAAPRLSSFVEDEALARAMALARGLNVPTDPYGTVQGTGPASRGGTGGGGGVGGGGRAPTGGASQRVPTLAAKTTPPGASAAQASKWQQIMGGLSSIIPLLIGKAGMNELTQKGIMGLLKGEYDKVFGPGAAEYMGDQSFAAIANNMAGLGVGSSDAGGVIFNPITGMPMFGQQPDAVLPPDTGAGWWGDSGYYYPDASAAWSDADPYGIGGYDYAAPAVDYWGYTDPGVWDDSGWWWPDSGGYWDTADPFGVGGW